MSPLSNYSADFIFEGVGISVCGTISALGNGVAPQSSYSIDGGAQSNYVAVQQADAQYKQCFFQSGTLSSAVHTLVIENTANGGNLYLDYLSVVSLNPSAVTSPTGSSSAVTVTATSSSSKSAPVGAIVGGIVAALAIIALVVAGALYMKRKRASQRPGREEDTNLMQTRSRVSREWHRNSAVWYLVPNLLLDSSRDAIRSPKLCNTGKRVF